MDARDRWLLAGTVWVWGTVWFAIPFQLGTVPPAVSVCYRMLLAAALLWCVLAAQGQPWRMDARAHLLSLLLGLCLFSLNYYLFYLAGIHLKTGLMSVLFSSIVLMNALMARLLLGSHLQARTLVGGVLGILGTALLFYPDIQAGGRLDAGMLKGIGLTLLATLLVASGNTASAILGRRVAVSTFTAWGMLYGSLIAAGLAAAQGHGPAWDARPSYLLSLLYLAWVCTALAFLLYLNLIRRIGTTKAAFATLLFPVVALMLSTVFESYRWTPVASAGAALVLAGSAWSLFGRERPSQG